MKPLGDKTMNTEHQIFSAALTAHLADMAQTDRDHNKVGAYRPTIAEEERSLRYTKALARCIYHTTAE